MEEKNFNDQVQEVLDTPDTTAEYDAADINNNKVMAILAYIGILVLVPVFAAKESKFARFHANQGLVLFIVSVILGALANIPLIGWAFSVLNIVTFVFCVLGIVNAATGKAKELPIIGSIKILN